MTAQENAGNALMLLLGEVVAKAVRAEMDAQRAALVAELQEWASPPQVQESEQLLGLEEIARRLDCSKQTVSARMASGELVWTAPGGSGDRKMRAAWLDEYIKNLPQYRGKRKDASAPVEVEQCP